MAVSVWSSTGKDLGLTFLQPSMELRPQKGAWLRQCTGRVHPHDLGLLVTVLQG